MDRPLTPEEVSVMSWLLTNSGENALKFLPQLSEIRVHGKCSCGCPTIDLAGARTIASDYHGTGLLADVVGEVSGTDVGVLLFQKDGLLTCLEIYAFGDNPPDFSLPKTSTLRGWEHMSQPVRAEIASTKLP
jgi:hypothetical protein